MADQNLNYMLLGILIGALVAIGILEVLGFPAAIAGLLYHMWNDGRNFAQSVTEQNHDRRLELLDTMIEIERTKQRVPAQESVIEGQEQVVNESVACQRKVYEYRQFILDRVILPEVLAEPVLRQARSGEN